MKPEEYFSEFVSELNLLNSEREEISKKHNALRDELRQLLPVEEDFLTGSYARNTIIRPQDDYEKFDIDFFLAFNKNDYGEFELPALLEIVNNSLEVIKNNTSEIIEITEQNRSIAIEFDDGFKIDVVPAIQIEKDRLYKIFDKRSKQPIKSNPKLHGKNLTNANDNSESGSFKRLVPIVKILKSWKRDKCDFVKSFHLELLVVKILENDPIESFSSGLFKFFNEVGEIIKNESLVDPANEENIVDLYLDEDNTRENLLTLIYQEKLIVNSASKYEDIGKHDEAIEEWKRIFDCDQENASSSSNHIEVKPTIITNPPINYCE